MKLCWGPPEQRPTAAQLQIIFSNLISSGKVHGKETQTDSKRLSQDFEQRWQNLKPNYIPKKDNTTEGDHGPGCLSISSKIKNAKVVDSSLVDSPLGLFMTNKISGQGSPRFCLKSDEEKSNKIEGNEEGEKNNFKIQDRCNVEEIRSNVSLLRKSDENEMKPKFELNTETRLPEILNPNQKFKNHEADVDSWLKGVEINNEEDESFVRKISEAIRDLDAALAMEKTSSSEEESGKSSHQNSPGKDLKENNETVVDFKLGSDISSFMNFTPKSFELTSLQNSEQPQSLNFTDPFINGSTEKFNDISTQGNLISAMIENPENKFEMKNYAFDESLKENDSLVGGQSRNSSDTDDEIWRKRIEKGEISEKVKEKSKSIANLMILTHIDASDESDNDLEKPFEKNLSRNSFSRRSGSFARSSISSNIFGSENDIMNAILEDDFKESLKKLSNDHKEYGRFDSLGMIMPTYAGRENVWENLFKNSVPGTESPFDLAPQISTPTDAHKNAEDSKLESDRVSNIFHPEEKPEQSAENSNNFLGKVASEKLIDNKSIHENAENKKSICTKKLEDSNCFSEQEDNLVQMNAKCDNTSDSDSSCSSKRNSSHPHKENSKNVGRVVPSLEEKTIGSTDFYSIPDETTANSENSYNNLLFKRKVGDESEPQTDVENVRPTAEASQVQYFTENKTPNLENIAFSKIPEITVSEAKQESEVAEEVVELPAAKIRPFKFVLKGEELIPEILITKEPEENASELEEKLEFNFENTKVKPFKFVLKEDEISLASEKPKTNETGAKNTVEEIKLNHKDLHESVSKQDCTNDNGSVIIGACEDCTLDFFKGLTTTSEDVSLEKKITEENEKRDAIFGCFSDTKNENVDWDNHLGETLTFQQNRQNFDGFDFESFECNNPKAETKESPKNLVDSPDCKNLNFSELCPVEIIVNFIESEKEHSDKVDEFFHINRITSFSGMSNEEEYDNFKLRTPDDERSSDSGFRDKGSLSESVEDACEGKYNLEDIEAELEEAYVKGAFGNCEVDKENDSGKESKNCNNFEYEESKFYEDENKNDDDFSDIDGEIEFWQNKDGSDYYPKISEFSPTCSQGWYLHPPDENLVTYNRTMNEDIANAIRNELRENLPVQTRSFSEFNEDFYEPALEDPKRDLNIHYASDISIPLSPIIEEHDATVSEAAKKNIKNSLFEGNSSSKVRKNVVNLMESVKSIDTNTFMQYLDYMVENEGRDLDDLEDIEEESCSKEKEKNTVNAIDNSSDILKTLKNKPDKENLTNVLTTASCDSNSEIKSHDIVCSVQPNNFKSDFTVIHNYDALMPDNVAFEGEEKKNSELKAEASFLDDERRKGDILEINTNDNFGETEDQIFSPEISSPDRERSLSDISRSSNDTRTGDALSEITLSSPDLVPDCFATSGQDGIQISEENEIENDFKGDGIGIRIDTLEESIGPDSKTQNELFLLNERNYCTDDMSKKFKIPEEKISAAKLSPIKVCNEPEENDLYEMSTSFMGENCDDVDDDYDEEDGGIDSQVHLHGNIINKEKKEEIKNQIGDENAKSEVNVDDTYTADWDSDSSAAEEMSSSSGEFIWKVSFFFIFSFSREKFSMCSFDLFYFFSKAYFVISGYDYY